MIKKSNISVFTKRFLITLTLWYIVSTLVFILDVWYILEMKGDGLKSFVYLGSPIAAVIAFLMNLSYLKSRSLHILNFLIPISFIIIFNSALLSGNFLTLLMFSKSSWQTQELIYENKSNKNLTIEYQMKDVGARGYRKRNVQVHYYTPWFMTTTEIDPKSNMSNDWVYVNKYVNELDIVY